MTCVFGDPSREPRLERAMPADAVPGSTIPEDSEAEILLRDGTWVWAQVIGQRKDRHGRWCVGIRWYASPTVGGREGWYLYDPRLIRRPPLTRAVVSAGRPAAAARGPDPRRTAGPGRSIRRSRTRLCRTPAPPTPARRRQNPAAHRSRAGPGRGVQRGRVAGSSHPAARTNARPATLRPA